MRIPATFLKRLAWFKTDGSKSDTTVANLVVWSDLQNTDYKLGDTIVSSALGAILSFVWDNRFKVLKAV